MLTIILNASYESKVTVPMIQAIAKPCDLIFLVYILVQTMKSDNANNELIEEMNYRSSLLANELVLQYRAKGYNLHVEPIHIPHARNTTVILSPSLRVTIRLILTLIGFETISIHSNTNETHSISF